MERCGGWGVGAPTVYCRLSNNGMQWPNNSLEMLNWLLISVFKDFRFETIYWFVLLNPNAQVNPMNPISFRKQPWLCGYWQIHSAFHHYVKQYHLSLAGFLSLVLSLSLRGVVLLVKYIQPLFRDGIVYFCSLRFCTVTSPRLFHLLVDGFQADVLLCLCVQPPVLSYRRKRRKGFCERYTTAFPATSRVHLKMRSDDTWAPSAPLCCSRFLALPFCSSLVLFWNIDSGVLWRQKTTLQLSSKRLTLWCKKGRETPLSAFKKMLCSNCTRFELQSNIPCCLPHLHKPNGRKCVKR